jgi:hypothetical protein
MYVDEFNKRISHLIFSSPRSVTYQAPKPFCFDTTGMFYWCPTQTVEQQTIVK